MTNKISLSLNGNELEFSTLPSLFSPSSPDRGSMAMLRYAQINQTDRVLDLGCGWGYVSAAAFFSGASYVLACDVDPNAVKTAQENFDKCDIPVKTVLSDGLDQIELRDFTLILSNPPYQSDFSVAKKFIAQSYAHLAPGGRLLMVTKRREWYKNRIIATFGGVKIDEDDGYYVFTAIKLDKKPAPVKKKKAALSKKLAKKHAGK